MTVRSTVYQALKSCKISIKGTTKTIIPKNRQIQKYRKLI